MRFDLCGMAVDKLRSCYRTKMRLRTDSDEETEVQWFFTRPGAKVYPGYTRFGSGNWAESRFSWPGTGEVLGAPREWVNGKLPKIGLMGQGFCGKHELIATGWTAADPPLPCHTDGKAKCCPGVATRIALATIAPRVIERCAACAVNWNAEFEVETDDTWAGPEDTFSLPGLAERVFDGIVRSGQCQYTGPWIYDPDLPMPVHWRLRRIDVGASHGWWLDLTALPGTNFSVFSVFKADPAYVCDAANLFTQVHAGPTPWSVNAIIRVK